MLYANTVPASGSVARIVPTALPLAALLFTENVWSLTTGASFTFVRFTVIVLLPNSCGTPLSVALTVRLKLGVVSKSNAVLLATVMAPVAALIVNALPVLPPVMLKVNVVPASGSVAVTVPTAVPFPLFSGTVNVAAFTVGASFTFVRLIVMIAVSLNCGVPLSVTVTLSVKLGVTSKFSAVLLATVITPAALTANAVCPVPPVTLIVRVCPASGSVDTIVPTVVPLAVFSATAKV